MGEAVKPDYEMAVWNYAWNEPERQKESLYTRREEGEIARMQEGESQGERRVG